MKDSAQVNDQQAPEVSENLIEREYALEMEAVDRAKLNIEKRITTRGFAEGSVTARVALRNSISLTTASLQKWLDAQRKLKRKSRVYRNLLLLEPEQLAFITGRVLLDQAFKEKSNFTGLCAKVGRQVKDVAEYAIFKEANKGLATTIEKQLLHTTSPKHSRAVTSAAMRSADFEGIQWNHSDIVTLGVVLVQCFVESTDLFERIVLRGGKKTTAYLVPTVTLQILLAQADIRDSLILPFHYPMLVKPTDWTTMENGGYLDQELHQVRLIKGDASLATRLDATDTSKVRSAVNNIQSTGWRINSRVLNVLQILNDAGDGSAGLASSLQPTIPEKPWPVMSKEEWTTWKEIDQNKEEFDKWRYLAKNAYRDQKKWAGHRLVQQQQIMVGEKFVDEAAIYFPHSLDFRGRVYPVAGMGSVNPQGNDAGKALLEFAEGLPLGPDGAKWLAIHLANTYGNDKCSFDDRELWAQMNSDWILECAEDPINNTRWHCADKPLCFLATCFEWQGYHKDGDDHISRTCVAMDGSCSGLQHYGAMLLDEGTCRAVNVIQTGDSPQDVYSVVLNKVTMLVKNNQDPLAMQWVTRLHRNICKQPIMTSVYSVTQRGITLQIETWIGKLVKKGEIEPFVDYTAMQAALFLAPIVLEAIGDELTAATCAMDWLKQVCKIVSATGSALEWQTPVGFTVFQSYRELKAEVVKITWAGKQQKLNIKTQSKDLAPKKCVNAIAANFVHSMDASHLMLVANVGKDHGIDSFGFIHDSFGTHPSNTTLLNEVIRECFIAQYEGDTLADFYEQIREQAEPEVFEQIEPPPRQGNMELQAVRDSLFFFA